VSNTVNFQWCKIFGGGLAEFFAFKLRTSANPQSNARLVLPLTSGAFGGSPPEPPRF